jgi:hypothetical protein
MTLWTPGGEHHVPDDEGGGGPGQGRPGGAGGPGGPDFDPDDLSDEDRARLEEMAGEMAEVRQQLLQVPASTVVANHAMGLYELAAIHLSSQPPGLAEARVAIDAMGGIVEGLEGRLGENERVLRDALAQLRLAFVQLQAAAGEGQGPTPGS